MQQKILPASVNLNKAYSSYLDTTYSSYTKNINIALVLLAAVCLAFLVILLGTQFFLFKRTHRIFNVGLLLATILFAANILYSVSALSSVKSDLYSAKHDAFNSIQALWNTRSTAYNANALESLYLLHNGTGIVQTADTINFNLSSSLICSDSKAASTGGKFEGYLGDVFGNITFQGEQDAAKSALNEWTKYVGIDKQIRNL
jgi:nitrogen fixation/metabolism regulation signal transduction histidine kinase